MPVGMMRRAHAGNTHCGDACGYWRRGERVVLGVADGLGHGVDAERAAQAALDYVAAHQETSLLDIFRGCDAALRQTRGAAMGLALIETAAACLTYAGIGNTRALLMGGTRLVRLSSDHGVLGAGYGRLVPRQMPIKPGDLVCLYTDGLASDLDLRGYPDALQTPLSRFVRAVMRDWHRSTDDAAVLLYRHEVR